MSHVGFTNIDDLLAYLNDEGKMKKRAKKMDPKLLSSEVHEIAYMAKKMGVSRTLVRLARKHAGRSRAAVRAFILGYMFN